MMKVFVKLIFMLGAAGIAGLLAPQFIPTGWRQNLDTPSFRSIVFFFVFFVIIDVATSLYIHFTDISSRKFIRHISACFLTLSGTFVVLPLISVSFQEARIKANFEKLLSEKKLNTDEIKAHIDASIKMADTNATTNAFPYFLTLTVALIVFCVLYHYLDSTREAAKVDLKKRKATTGKGR